MDLSLLSNLTSVSVLAFVLGGIGFALRADLRIPEQAYQVISMTLLFGIGLKGGLALHKSNPADLIAPGLMTLGLGSLIPMLAFAALRLIKRLNNVDRGAIAAHYGSTSLVTFTSALVFLDASNISYESYVNALLVIMEIPGILIGILLASGIRNALGNRELLREVILGKTVLLMLGGLIIGLVSGTLGVEKVAPLFVDLQPGILTLFLLNLGYLAMSRIGDLRTVGAGVAIFAVTFPLVAGFIGALAGTAFGMSVGGSAALAVLCASASYIAAPAAVGLALPQASTSLSLVSSLGITFPLNLTLGIPIYIAMSEALVGLV